MKKNEGITLIALVITVILLLILAGVTISIINHNRILDKADYVAYKYGYEQAKEKLMLCLTEYKFDKIVDKNAILKDKLNEVDDNHNVSEVNNGKYYLVTIDGYKFYVEVDTLKILDAVDGDTINFPINEPGTYRIVVNANEQAEWISLTKINEVIPEGTSIEYKFETSNDRNEWEEWSSIEEINANNVLSQYLRVTAILTENKTTGECSSVDGLKVKFKINIIEEIFEIIDDTYLVEYKDSYRLKDGYDSGVVSQHLTIVNEPMTPEEIDEKINYPTITITTDTTTTIVSSKDIASVYVGNKNSSGQIEWIPIEDAPESETYSHVRVDIPISKNQTVSKASLNPTSEKNIDVMDIEWITVKKQYYYIDATSPYGEWLSIEPDETIYDNTRIIYTFAKSNDDESYSGEYEEITENNPSRYLRITAELQVRNESVTKYPKINEMNVNYILNGRKYSTVPLNKEVVWELNCLYKSVNVKATSPDENNPVLKIKLKDGETIESNNATFGINSAGTYEFIAYLNDGTISQKYIEVTEEDLLKFDMFKYMKVREKSLADMGISIVSKTNCEDWSQVPGKIGGGHHNAYEKWDYSFKVMANEVYEILNFNQISITASLWASGSSNCYENVIVYYTDGTSSTATTIGSQTNSELWKTSTISLNVEEGKTVDYLLFKAWGIDADFYSSQANITNITFK